MSGAVGDFVLWIVGGFASALATLGVPVGAVVKRNHDRSKKNQRQLEGDPGDPNVEGVLTIAYETREEVQGLRREVRESRECIMDRLSEMDAADDT